MPAPKKKIPTLAALSSQLLEDQQLDPALARRHVSAIKRFCKVVDRLPGETLAEPAEIRALLGKAPWQAHMKKSSWATVVSNLKAAMAAGAVDVLRSHGNHGKSEAWKALLGDLSVTGRRNLGRFAGWCSAHGIEPDQVSVGTFADFLDQLRNRDIQRDPKESWNRPRRAWNGEVVPLSQHAFPEIANVETNRNWTSLPWSAFPQSLQSEIEQYRQTMASPDIDDDREPLKPVTISNYATALRYQLSRLVQDGVPAEEFSSISDCLSPERIRRGLRLLQAGRNVDETTQPMLHLTTHAYLSFAKYSQASDATFDVLRKVARKARSKKDGLRPRNIERLAQFDDDDARRRFRALPLTVAAQLAKVDRPDKAQALLMRNAVMLEFLLHMPLRIRNVVELDLDRHVQRVSTDEGPCWRIVIPGHEVKNGVQLPASLPPVTSRLMERWRKDYRPILEPQCSRMFIGRTGEPIDEGPLSRSFKAFIQRETGLEVNPHLMRHLAAMTFLKANPGHYEEVRRMLGHTTTSTTIASYCGAETEAAFARYDALIADDRAAFIPDDL